MSTFDVAVGMDKSTLNKGTSQLYANPNAREKLFKGSVEGTDDQSKKPYQVTWDIQAAPTFTLSAPALALWKASVDAKGNHPAEGDLPVTNLFQMTFPQFDGEFTLGQAQPLSGTTQVIVTLTASVTGNKLSLSPKAVWLDETAMTGWDKVILNKIVLPKVLQQAGAMLSRFDIPPLSRTIRGVTVELTSPQVAVAQELLVAAASMKSKGSVEITGVIWPTQQPLFFLISADLVQYVAKALADEQLKGWNIDETGDYKSLATWDYKVQISDVAVSANGADMTKIGANASFSLSGHLGLFGANVCPVTTAAKGL